MRLRVYLYMYLNHTHIHTPTNRWRILVYDSYDQNQAQFLFIQYVFYIHTCTAYCIGSLMSSISHLNRDSSSLGLFCHVLLERDQGD